MYREYRQSVGVDSSSRLVPSRDFNWPIEFPEDGLLVNDRRFKL